AEPRLGLHPVVMSDGPQGVRGTGADPSATGLLAPAPSALGATWDPELATRLGALFAREARRKGVHVLLAPLVNLQRTPVAGRHFEYLAEDPLLTGELAAALVTGLQDAGVAACLKHFVANDSETDRTRYRSRVDERTLREVYLAPFERVLGEGGAWSVMAAYSGVEHPVTDLRAHVGPDAAEAAPMTEHRRLLRGVLKGEWEFAGPVVSDWAATRSTAASALGGLDLVMPGPDGPWGPALVAAVRAGRVPEELVDDKVIRLLWLAERVGRRTAPWAPGDRAPVPPSEHLAPVPAEPADDERALLRETAARSTVALRAATLADGTTLLPLDPGALRRVALIGPNAVAPYLQGGGSAYVPAGRTVGYADGLREALPPHVELTVHRGGDARRLPPFVDPELLTDPDTGTTGVRADHFDADGRLLGTTVRPTGDWGHHGDYPAATHRVVLRTRLTLTEPGTHHLVAGAIGRYRALLDGERIAAGDDDRGVELVLDSTHNNPRTTTTEITVPDGGTRSHDLEIGLDVVDAEGYGRFVTCHLRHRPPRQSAREEMTEAVAAAREADVAVVVVGTNEEVESEGWDRTGLELPGPQDELVRAVAAANPRTVAVVNAGAPVLLPWAREVPSLLWAWLPGQEAGHALADVLLGRVEPAGRLPWTLPARAGDVPVPHAVPVDSVVAYEEGPDIGHRAWDREHRVPAYPFGHGVGWTEWRYDAVSVSGSVLTDSPLSAAGLPGGEREIGPVRLRVSVTNTGPRSGREVVQVYLEAPQEGWRRPVRSLAGFAVVTAEPGETAVAEITVAPRAFQLWDPAVGDWCTPPGRYRLRIGRSSRELPLTAELD
uniref:beta-glucosidase n=2 Tax=unclassified Streptomyces TaxID=2593676 RepID=UPI001CA4AE57